MAKKLTADERAEITRQAVALNSDGCSHAKDFYRICCYEHDIQYFTGKNWKGEEVTKAQADTRFRQCIQSESILGKIKLGFLSPMAWIRWAMVKKFGKGEWVRGESPTEKTDEDAGVKRP